MTPEQAESARNDLSRYSTSLIGKEIINKLDSIIRRLDKVEDTILKMQINNNTN